MIVFAKAKSIGKSNGVLQAPGVFVLVSSFGTHYVLRLIRAFARDFSLFKTYPKKADISRCFEFSIWLLLLLLKKLPTQLSFKEIERFVIE